MVARKLPFPDCNLYQNSPFLALGDLTPSINIINIFSVYYMELVKVTWRIGALAAIITRCITQEESKRDRGEDFGQYMSVGDADIEPSVDFVDQR